MANSTSVTEVVRFDIRPYVGAFPIEFGMTKQDVHRILGPPESSFPIWNRSGYAEHYGGGFNVGYDNSWNVMHLGFGPGSFELAIQEKVIWTARSHRDPNPIILALDPNPVEFVGIWNFLLIGVTTTGYHDDDPAQRAITVFPRGAKDEFAAEFEPADTSRYRVK